MNNKMNHPLITVDGRTLMDRPLEPPNFVVDTLISQGLHILAGSPKVGKSWLALWLAVTVAKGEPVWNMTTRQGTTLYLESYLGYKLEPNEDPEADWRLDTMVGSTCCAPLVNGYLDADNDFMDALQADGAAAGFFCYSLDTLREEKGTEKIFGFRDKLEEALTAGDGRRSSPSPAGPPASSAAMWTSSPGTSGLFCRKPRSSSRAATSPGPASTPSAGRRARWP